MCGLAADADGVADVHPGRAGSFRGGDSFVEPVSGLAVFPGGCLHAEECFGGADMGFSLVMDVIFDS